MNQSWKIILSAGLAMAVSTLLACSKSGGGGSAASTPTTSCAGGGLCITSGAPGYVGDGTWAGRLTINNAQAFQQFAYENGLCGGQDCAYVSSYYADLRLYLQNGGCLPGQGTFSLRTYMQGGYGGRTMTQRADALTNAAGNGFVVNYVSQQYMNGQIPFMNVNSGVPQTTAPGTLQIAAQFADATHTNLVIQVFYRGVQIASGSNYGQAQYDAGAAANASQYCSMAGMNGGGGNWNNGWNTGFGNGFGNNGGGSYYYVNGRLYYRGY
jgi:hypothetical protein